jgi:nicotinamidase-related amidase
MTSIKRKYDELKIDGPPLFKQGCIPTDFKSPQKTTSNVFDGASSSLSGAQPSSSSLSTADVNNSNVSPHQNHHYGPPLIDPSTTALLIVDVQPEYWSECPPVRRDFPNFPTKISNLLTHCRSNNTKRIIWVRADYSYEHSPWLHQFARLHNGSIPPIVRPSSKWENFAQPLDDEMVITKTSWSSTSGGTGLLETLKHDGIDTVLVCGLITSVCVQHSAFGVFEAGYRTILVTDACADRGRARHEAALALYGDYMYELRSVDSLKVELEKKMKKSAEVKSEDVEEKEKGDDMMMMKKHKNGKKKKLVDDSNIMSSSLMQGVSVSLPFQKDCGGGISREKMMIKSESNDSLTSATSYDDSVSSIDDDDDAAIVTAATVGGTVVNE